MNVERILSRAVRDTNGDLIWQGPLNNNGYASLGGVLVHRIVYEHFVGPIPEGFEIDHVWERGCRSRACIDWTHFEAVTHAENQERRRSSHCSLGLHEMIGNNVLVDPRTKKRRCRKCRNGYQRRRRARLASTRR